MGIVGNFGNQQMYLEKKREPRGRDSRASRSSPSLVLRGLVAQLSHLPKSETECDVTPPVSRPSLANALSRLPNGSGKHSAAVHLRLEGNPEQVWSGISAATAAAGPRN